MSAIHQRHGFRARVAHAAHVIRENGEAGQDFDTCFEMWDGDAVAVALWRMSKYDMLLAMNLPKFIGTGDKLMAVVERYKHVPDEQLDRVSRDLIKQSAHECAGQTALAL